MLCLGKYITMLQVYIKSDADFETCRGNQTARHEVEGVLYEPRLMHRRCDTMLYARKW